MSRTGGAAARPRKRRNPKDDLFPIRETRLYRVSRLPVVKKLLRFSETALLPRVSPQLALSLHYLKTFGYWPDLRRPITFNEKVNWKKINDRRGIVALTADKFAVRDYVRSKGLGSILIPLLWHGTDPEAIPFERLPDGFVVKPNHLSGAVAVVRDRRVADAASMIKQAKVWMATEYYPKYLEWAYKNIKPLILVEELLGCDDEGWCPDYKFFCFHGEPRYCQVDTGRFGDHRRNIHDLDWGLLPVMYNYRNGPPVPRPGNLDDMVRVCRALSRDFGFVRVDLYSARGRVFFGELTHYPEAGFGMFNPPEFDLELGECWRVGA